MSEALRAELARFADTLPLAEAHTIPAAWYRCTEIAALEQAAVFGDSWQVAGRSDQVARPGDFLTAEVAGGPIAVLRDTAGTLRAFHNVCRHRAAPVLTAPQGNTTKLRCNYHGWTYDLAGCLRGVPEFEGVAAFCREDEGLLPVAVAAWGPFVLVHAGANQPPLTEHVAPLPARLAATRFESLRFVERRSYEIACNWKVYVDNYLDGGYHVNTIHPGLASVLDYRAYRTELFATTSLQSSPLQAPAAGEDTTVAQVRSGEMAYYAWVFPNFMLNVYAGLMDTNLVIPLGPHRR